MTRRALALVVTAVAAIAASIPAVGQTPKPRIDDPGRTFSTTRLLSDGSGGLVGWDDESRTLTQWNADGVLTATCKPKFGPTAAGWAKVAARGNEAIFVFSDTVVGKGDERRLAVVDIDRCEVAATGPFPIGHPVYLAAGRYDWLTTARPVAKELDRFVFVAFDDEGTTTAAYDAYGAIDELVTKGKLEAPFGPHLAEMAVAANEVWILPKATYALLRPPQGGLPLRTVEPPDCLAAGGTVRNGRDAAKIFRDKILKRLSPDDRKQSEERLSKGGQITGFEYSFGSVVAYRRYLAVTPNDPRLKGGSRLDIWDMVTESLVAVLPFNSSETLVGFSDERAWVLAEDHSVRSMVLPELAEPLDEPCKTYAKLLEATSPPAAPAKTVESN